MRMKMVCDDRTLAEVANEFLALKKAQKVRERTLNDYKKYIDKFLEIRDYNYLAKNWEFTRFLVNSQFWQIAVIRIQNRNGRFCGEPPYVYGGSLSF